MSCYYVNSLSLSFSLSLWTRGSTICGTIPWAQLQFPETMSELCSKRRTRTRWAKTCPLSLSLLISKHCKHAKKKNPAQISVWSRWSVYRVAHFSAAEPLWWDLHSSWTAHLYTVSCQTDCYEKGLFFFFLAVRTRAYCIVVAIVSQNLQSRLYLPSSVSSC